MPFPRLRPLAAVATTVALGFSGVALGSVPATAASAELMIGEVYGGGGNSGAAYVNDFVELVNRGTQRVSLQGLSLQYGAAGGFLGGGGTPGSGSLKVDLQGTVAPGKTFLVQLAAGSGNGAALPPPDQASTAINLSGTNGKLALVRSTAVLACGNACATDQAVVDFLGYGNANDAEGQPAPATANATSSSRGAGPDTDDNATDFSTGAPTPTNSGGTDPGPGDPLEHTIPQIQGPGHLSPDDTKLVKTKGVVSARKFDGYWLQDPAGDGNELTSDGIFVYTEAAGAKPNVGQTVEVVGKVDEFRPRSATGPNLNLTELTNSKFTVLPETNPVPAPVLIGPGGRVAPAQSTDSGPTTRSDIELPGAEFLPQRDAVDFYEALEGMLVEVRDARVVAARNDFGELVVLPGGTVASASTPSGGVLYAYGQPNSQRLTVDDEIIYQQMPVADVGDTLPGVVSGPLSYDFGMFRVFPTAAPTVRAGGLKKDVFSATPRTDEVTVATFNVENLDPKDPAEKFDRLASTIVDNLGSPDILGLEEVQDNTGAECPNGPSPSCTADGVVAADQTLAKLVASIAAAGGPTYEWREISPQNLTDGGEPTGNIRVAFLFRTDRGVRFVDRPGGSATSAVGVTKIRGKVALTQSPGRISPTLAAWNSSRKPLAGEFTFRGQTLFVVANHFNSKGGDDSLMGRWQPQQRGSETQRHQQARLVNGFVRSLLAVDSSARVVVLGDINDFEFSETTALLEAGDALIDLPQELPAAERYSYVFEGNSQILDHILVSRSLMGVRKPGPWPPAPSPDSGIRAYQIVHVNAEFHDQVSDHDPQVVHLALHVRP